MTYKGDYIGETPSFGLLESYIAEKGLFVEAQFAWDYWERKGWKTKKGEYVKSVEAAVNVANSDAITKFRKQNKTYVSKKEIRQKLKEQIERKKEKYFPKYENQLKDKRWLAFRKFIFAVRGGKCEMCNADYDLQIHHLRYIKGAYAWEYTCNDVMVVCGTCHKKIHKID